MLKCLITDPPLKQTNFIAFYSDGSGAGIFCWDGGKIKDAEGVFVCRSSEISGHFFDAGYDRWLPLPDDFKFWFRSK